MCIRIAAGDLIVDVTDSGQRNSDTWTPGVGIASMRERAAELGGTLTVAIGRRGTTVHAVLPLN